MVKVLVTGAAGFIGSHVCEALLERGDKVIGIDNLNDYYNPKFKERNIQIALKHKDYQFHKADIRNGLAKFFDNTDKVIHLAAMAGVRNSIDNPTIYHEVNVDGTKSLLALANEYGINRFVFASSSSVYGDTTKIPFKEQITGKTLSPYAETKRLGEVLCKTASDVNDLSVACLRFFTVYGPRGRPDMAVYKFTKAISEDKPITMYGDGTSERDYTYVTDIVKGVLAALDSQSRFDVFNLGNSKPVVLKKLVRLIEKEVGKTAVIERQPMQKGDVEKTWADLAHSKAILSYEPKISIEEGIKRFVEWYKEKN